MAWMKCNHDFGFGLGNGYVCQKCGKRCPPKQVATNRTGETIEAGSLIEIDITNGNITKVTPPEKATATNKTSITKLNTIYELRNSHGEMIEAEVHNGKLTLSNHKGYEEFVFVGSDPARVRRIANLMLEAVKIVEKV